MNKTLIIAEAGVNHNGSLKTACKMVDAAKVAGADIIKFQTFKAEEIVSPSAEKADYQRKTTGADETQYEMLRRLELTHAEFVELKDYCDERKIVFLSTAFDCSSLKFLVEEINVARLKIPSGEITNAPLVLAHARTKKEIILSTGMSTIEDIKRALSVIAFGSNSDARPVQGSFQDAFNSEQGQKVLQDKVTVLHCTTEYPAALENINLRAMQTIKNTFNLPVGYSDHSEGILVSLSAVASGAVMIEKHFTLDKNMEGPDHKASLDPNELGELVQSIRKVERVMGSEQKISTENELKNRSAARKSLTARVDIQKGDMFTEQNLGVMRPGDGQSPFLYWEYLSKRADKDYAAGDLI